MLSKTANKKCQPYFNNYFSLPKAAMFPRVCDIEKLPTDLTLKPIKLISIIKRKSKNILTIKFKLEDLISLADVYLFVNGYKKDMYYSVPSGIYRFNFRELQCANNLIEIFYIQNGVKSESTLLNVSV